MPDLNAPVTPPVEDDDAPEPETCFYCGEEPASDAHYPYCSVGCGVLAELDQ